MLYYYVVFSVVITSMLLMLAFAGIFYTVVKDVCIHRKWIKISKFSRRGKK